MDKDKAATLAREIDNIFSEANPLVYGNYVNLKELLEVLEGIAFDKSKKLSKDFNKETD